MLEFAGFRIEDSPLGFTQLNVFRSYPGTERQHFEEHGSIAFADCVLVIRHGSRYGYTKRAWHSSFYWRSRLLRMNYAFNPTA